MEDRLKKIEEKLEEIDKRLSQIENQAITGETRDLKKEGSEREPVRFDNDGRPFFNIVLPNGTKKEIQRAAILIIMKVKRNSDPEISSKRISSLLHKAGVDIHGIKNTYYSLRMENPPLITSKPKERTIILTSHGESEAVRLLKELTWK